MASEPEKRREKRPALCAVICFIILERIKPPTFVRGYIIGRDKERMEEVIERWRILKLEPYRGNPEFQCNGVTYTYTLDPRHLGPNDLDDVESIRKVVKTCQGGSPTSPEIDALGEVVEPPPELAEYERTLDDEVNKFTLKEFGRRF